MKKNILVTCAFPYSNGPIHLGHILEHIQADIWVKYQRLLGNNVYFMSSDDSHGTAVLLKSKELNINIKNMIYENFISHKNQFFKFNIIHDIYYNTNSKYNKLFLINLIKKCNKNNLLYIKNILQYYDIKKKIFLPDRYLIGICPKCKSNNQYGDNCNICGGFYNSLNLLKPKSIISNSIPILRNSKNLFLNITRFKNNILDWLKNIKLNECILNQLINFLSTDNLFDWNISRDKPYFGFRIPSNIINEKYFYVWFDALLGYISLFYKFCIKNNNKILFYNFWNLNSNYEIYNFIGKDVLYFHGILWPCILEIFNYRKPTNIIVHGHILVNNIKMSKSYGNFITICKWLNYFDSDSLRYYFASLLSSNVCDINFCFRNFINKINSDLVNKFVNIASRNSTFLENKFNNILSNKLWDYKFYYLFLNKKNKINDLYLNFNYSKILLEINILFDIVNKYINDNKPWYFFNNNFNKLHMFCTTIINIFRVISIYLYPIIPNIIKKVEIYLNEVLSWDSLNNILLNHKLSKYNVLYSKIFYNNVFDLNK